MKLFDKLKKAHFRTDPEEHFYAQMIYNLSEYDRLYENQLNQNSQVWTSFRNAYNIEYKFLENIEKILDCKPQQISGNVHKREGRAPRVTERCLG